MLIVEGDLAAVGETIEHYENNLKLLRKMEALLPGLTGTDKSVLKQEAKDLRGFLKEQSLRIQEDISDIKRKVAKRRVSFLLT